MTPQGVENIKNILEKAYDYLSTIYLIGKGDGGLLVCYVAAVEIIVKISLTRKIVGLTNITNLYTNDPVSSISCI